MGERVNPALREREVMKSQNNFVDEEKNLAVPSGTVTKDSLSDATPSCRWCARGDVAAILDDDRTLSSVSGNHGGVLSHAYEEFWWPCLRFGTAYKENVAWQPIANAPLNVSVLVYIPNAEHYGEGIYRALKKQSVGQAQIWMTTGLHHGSDVRQDFQPTHWLPLPDVPNTQDTNTSASDGTT